MVYHPINGYTLPRGGLCLHGYASVGVLGQRSLSRRIGCDIDAGAWMRLALILEPTIAREGVSLTAEHLCPHTFGHVDRVLLPLLIWRTAPDPIV